MVPLKFRTERQHELCLLEELKACSRERDLNKGKRVHANAVQLGNESIFLASSLVKMYGKCGRMEDAQKIFEAIPGRDVVPWTALIMGYAENGQEKLALQLFDLLQREEGCKPNSQTFVAALKACSNLSAKEDRVVRVDELHQKNLKKKLVKATTLQKCVDLHSQAAKSGLATGIFVANSLVDLYANCGSMIEAQSVFDKMDFHDVVSWNSLILGYAENGDGETALKLFQSMRCEANARTYVAALKACTFLAAQDHEDHYLTLERGMAIHSQAVRRDFDKDIFVANMLVDLYAKVGKMADCRNVFDKIRHPNVISWTALILGYVESGEAEEALKLFSRMRSEGCEADARTYVAALKACIGIAAKEIGSRSFNGNKLVKLASLEKGMALHSQAAKRGFETDLFVGNSLVDLYSRCGSLADAQKVFDGMKLRNVVSWTELMMGYTEAGESELALQLFEKMLLELDDHESSQRCDRHMIDPPCFVAALKACSSSSEKEVGKNVNSWKRAEDGGGGGGFVKMQGLERAMAIHSEAARRSLDANAFVASSLVEVYARCGSMIDSRNVFDKIVSPGVVPWTALILGYAEDHQGKLALDLFSRMIDEEGRCVVPDSQTFVAAIKACESSSNSEAGKKIHAEICRRGLETGAVLATCLIDFHAKCGTSIDDAVRIFDSVSVPGLVTWNTLIAGFSCKGDVDRALELLERMKEEGNFAGDAITYLLVLTVCGHAGMVEKCGFYFREMTIECGIEAGIEHYHCMVDMLGRVNEVGEAVGVISSMPFSPSAVTWRSLLGACEKWRNAGLAKAAFQRLVGLDKGDPAAYMLMANAYGTD